MEALFSYFVIPLLIVIFISIGALKIAHIFLDVWIVIANNLFRNYQSIRDIGRKNRKNREQQDEQKEEKEES